MSIKSVTRNATRIKEEVINPLETTNNADFSEECSTGKVLIQKKRWQASKFQQAFWNSHNSHIEK